MSEEAAEYHTRPPEKNHLKEFLASTETFLTNGRYYNIRREDIPALLELLEAYHTAFADLLSKSKPLDQ